MNTPNTLVELDIRNLHRPLATLQPMQLCAYSVKLTNVPPEMKDVKVTIMKANDEHFTPMPCTQDGNGDWYCNLIGGFFPQAGETVYQVTMSDFDGRRFAGGKGRVIVEPFDSVGGGSVTPQGDIILTEIPDDNGNSHRIKAVKVDGEWTWRIED